MENGGFHEDGSSGGRRQTSPPWTFAQIEKRKPKMRHYFQSLFGRLNGGDVGDRWEMFTAAKINRSHNIKLLTYFSFFQSFSILKMSSLSRLTWDRRRYDCLRGGPSGVRLLSLIR